MKEFIEVVGELNAGIVNSTLTTQLRDTVQRVLHNRKQGEVALKLVVKPVDGSETQVLIEATHSNKMPTAKGNKAETATDSMVMHASVRGDLSVTPHKVTTPGGVELDV